LLGLLGLIPLVGAFVGLALILYSIFRYKDKLLFLIGLAGIVFSIFIYSSLFALTKTSTVKTALAQFSQQSLNSLSRNLEFYKIEHGHYPDSLEELQKDVMFAPISDPVAKFGAHMAFHYENRGDKYLLFSAGKDGIENTIDDLYPDIKFDSSKIKFNFIKRKD